MAHHVEPMDVDDMDKDFDKENSLHHSNMLPCTEKGYEELDVSELNMKLRYSVTPASSPMSKSYTANRTVDLSEESLNVTVTENNLTRSLNSSINKNEQQSKGLKSLPLQSLSTDGFTDYSRNKSVLRQLDTSPVHDNDVTITVSGINDDENLSLPSSSSSALQTPEATTPTKEISKTDSGSPIMRGLKSVLNMFRSSQSPIPPSEDDALSVKQILSPSECLDSSQGKTVDNVVSASTPIASHRWEAGSKRSSPYKDSIVFNDDLEKELQWKDETTILFSHEKIPIHKLLFQRKPDQPITNANKLNTTEEYMDVSYNDSMNDKTMTDIMTETNIKSECYAAAESDSEFLDCETTFTKHESDQKHGIQENNEGYKTDSVLDKVQAIFTDEVNLLFDQTRTLDGSRLIDELPMISEIKNTYVSDNSPNNLNVAEQYNLMKHDNSVQHLSNQLSNAQAGLETSESKYHEEIGTVEEVDVKIIEESPVTIITKANSELEADHSGHKDVTAIIDTSTINEVVPELLNNQNNEATVIVDDSSPNIDITHNVDANLNADCPSNIPLPDDDIDSDIDLNTDNIIKDFNTTQNICDSIDEVLKHDLTQTVSANSVNEVVHERSLKDFLYEEKAENDNTKIEPLDVNPNLSIDSFQLLSDIDKEIDSTSGNSANNCNTTHNLPETSDKPIEHDVTPTITTVTNLDELGELVKDNELVHTNPDISADSMKLLNDIEDIVEPNNSNSGELKIEHVLPMTQNEGTFEESIKPTSENILGISDEVKILGVVLDDTTPVIKVPHTELECVKQNIVSAELRLGKAATEGVSDMEAFFDDYNTQDNTITLTDSNPQQLEGSLMAEGSESKEVPIDEEQSSVPEPSNILVDESTSNIIPTPASEIENCTEQVNDDFNIKDISFKEVEQNVDSITPIPEDTISKIGDIALIKTNIEVKMEPELNMSIDVTDDIPACDGTFITNVIKDDYVPSYLLDQSSIRNEIVIPMIRHEEDTISPAISLVATAEQKVKEPLVENVEKDIPEVNEDTKPIELTSSVLVEKVGESIDESEKSHEEGPESGDKISLNNDKSYAVPDITTLNNCVPTQEANEDKLIEEMVDAAPEKELIKDEEIILSENTSPFVSMVADIDVDLMAKVETQCLNETLPVPPSSPPIKSKGYNFNFDEMDDPFATKTNIRSSPPPNTPDKSNDDTFVKKDVPKRNLRTNKRKSLPEKRQQVIDRSKLNSTFSGHSNNTMKNIDNDGEFQREEVNKAECQSVETTENISIELDKQEISEMDEFIANEEKCNEYPPGPMQNDESVLSVDVGDNVDISITEQKNSPKNTPEIKTTSSSEQSTYYSVGTSSNESIPSRNVFNLPEIDDMNFNPFATKSKMRQSPPPLTNRLSEINIEKHDTTFNDYENIKMSDDKMDLEPMEKESSGNLSSITSSSKNTEVTNATVREINTEDEDTIEGPFFEAEDLDDLNIDKISDENVESLEVNDLPTLANDMPGEMFIDAEAFEFLLNQNQTNTIADSGKESLFLKFDPLFAKRMSSEAFAAFDKIQKRQSTPTKAKTQQRDITIDKSPIPGPSNLNATYNEETNLVDASNEDLNVTVSKPMMVVTPAVSSAVTPRNKSLTPTRPNRHSITFTSPAMAVIDRLLSMSANNSLVGQDTTFTHTTREQHEADVALTQLRELLAEKEINVFNLRSESKELKDRLTTLESQMHSLETESQDRLKKINELNERLSEKTRINRSMAAVVEEYERTIASLIAELEQDKKRHAEERMQLIKERDEQTAHLSSMEVSFSDLHSKYEKSKQIILSCKAAEDTYKKTIQDSMDNFKKMQNNYELLKQHATSKLNHANTELEKINRSHEAEVLKLNAMIKRKDLHITSLEETLTQKTKANEELTAICDELINKVG